ncbi:MAG: aminopeptidase P family protein [bacterium]|nr:aminopeptidase P family protein [bacterium]
MSNRGHWCARPTTPASLWALHCDRSGLVTAINFPDVDYGARIDRARTEMARRGLDALLLSVGSDLPYLTGYEAMPLERLTMGVITPTDSTLVVPQLEAPRVVDRGCFDVIPWAETEDPVGIVQGLMGGATAAIGAQTWSLFLVRLQQAAPGVTFSDATDVMKSLRTIKDVEEIELLRRAGAAVDRVVGRLRSMRFSGQSEAALARQVMEMTVEEGHDVATFHIVASGPNAASPHHEPAGREIVDGDCVVVDFGGRFGGYCSDTTRTFHVGEPTAEYAEAFSALHAAQLAGTAAAGPGVVAEDIDRASRCVLAEAGWGEWFIHRLGHGIGLDGHEDPYLVEGNKEVLQPGMAFSIEPGIYVPDKWGMRIEDIVVCTEDGRESLNTSPRDLAIVE